MIEEFASRLVAGFSPATLILVTLVSIVAALVMRRWSQLSAATLFAFGADCLARYVLELGATDGVPVNFAMELAMTRLDTGAISAMARPFLYLGVIASLFWVKKRYGGK
ncbi:MAG: hypothetical protein ACQRW7_03730 [Caulobacterales bacterium]|uniref:hypothetical protein n=1 Tax=Glycocaulis sp. TaxID=1969725 RepID=UPI003FA06B14